MARADDYAAVHCLCWQLSLTTSDLHKTDGATKLSMLRRWNPVTTQSLATYSMLLCHAVVVTWPYCLDPNMPRASSTLAWWCTAGRQVSHTFWVRFLGFFGHIPNLAMSVSVHCLIDAERHPAIPVSHYQSFAAYKHLGLTGLARELLMYTFATVAVMLAHCINVVCAR